MTGSSDEGIEESDDHLQFILHGDDMQHIFDYVFQLPMAPVRHARISYQL